MRYFFLFPLCLLGFMACSDNSGELVDKEPGTVTPLNEANTASGLPESHPPLNPDTTSDGSTMPMPMPGGGVQAVVDGTSVKAGVLAFSVDPGWISESPKNAMRSAQFRLPPPEGSEDGAGELVLFHGISGSADANIQRWIGQFSEPEGEPSIVKKTVGELSVHLLDVSGFYSGAMGMAAPAVEKTKTRMLAAVIEGHPNGPWFFKLTGPVKTLEHWKPVFNEMIDSAKIVP